VNEDGDDNEGFDELYDEINQLIQCPARKLNAQKFECSKT
jgi:hypothetical protein